MTGQELDQLLERYTRRVAEAVGDVHWPADGRHVSLRPVDSHRFVNGGIQIARRNRSLGNVTSVFIARADNAPASNAAATYQHRPAVRPVIPSRFRVNH